MEAKGLAVISGPMPACWRRGTARDRPRAGFRGGSDLRAGRLQSLLGEFEPDPVSVGIVYPATPHLAAKICVFVDFLALRFAGAPPWPKGWS